MRLKLFYLIFFLLLFTLAESRRSRGRGRGSSSGSTSFWNRKNGKNSSMPQKPAAEYQKPPQPPPQKSKPSAPKETEIKKENANVQQHAPQASNAGRPIGWDVNNNQMGQTNLHAQKQNVNPSYASGAGAYGHNPGANAYNPGPYGHNPGANPYNPGAYGHNPVAYGQNPGGGYGQNPGLYPNTYSHSGLNQGYPGHNSYSPYSPPGANTGYNPNMGGYGGYGHNSQMSGYGNYPQQTGMMGSMFGNSKHGFGGYGGYGGLGGYGGYGVKKSGGFFGKHAFRNVIGGLAVWYLVSGLISSPYKVYSYYTIPKEERKEITLPANVLTLCNENATSICVPGSTAICTQDNRILCVTNMTSTTPCQDNNGDLCIKSTVPCLDSNDPLCQNKTTADNTTTINLPCFTNMTLEPGAASSASNMTLPTSENNKFCVTAMAVPDPSLPAENGTTSGDKMNNLGPNSNQNGNENQTMSNFTNTEYNPPPFYPYGYGYGYGYMPYAGPSSLDVTSDESSNNTQTTQQ